ncbi:FprA family A-type flavoprotein [Hominiventricola filiformis]|uniref:FprA family A-type flavoprotein n=1 Tax=Hominiventricola filiformis TaxID=2885352 RepID=A0AAE3A9Q3_9FIRM|nr:MBL fold metallo-hydrolase [Hominiventricola filiformis]MCC2127032.1 FprA family A-type flavoprotein [Hominiventricola filiformis]
MSDVKVTDSVLYVGCDDLDIDLFESQYHVPNGVSYNSYVILDEKIAIMDTVDPRRTEEWLEKVEKALGGRLPDYLVVQHMEPDHAGSIQKICTKYPQMQIVSNAKVFGMMPQFFDFDLTGRTITVKEGDTLSLGSHTLTFFMAPMVHWPEVMVTYEASEKILFSADGFGKFGALSVEEDWTDEARRYFINIVGKYGAQVQNLLKKAATLDIAMICPLHGPVLKEDLGYYIGKYLTWSSYEPEEDGIVIACASIHGNTKRAMLKFVEILKEKGAENVKFFDLSRDDMAEAIAEAYQYSKLVVACPTYDGVLFPCMEDFLYHLKIKNFQNRKAAIVENGSWAPMSGKLMKAYLEGMKNITLVEPTVTIKSTMSEKNLEELNALADALLA